MAGRNGGKRQGETAFSAGSRLYQFNAMPFGLCNAPATFERLMWRVLVVLPWHIVPTFLDDVIVNVKYFEEAFRWLRLILQQLRSVIQGSAQGNVPCSSRRLLSLAML